MISLMIHHMSYITSQSVKIYTATVIAHSGEYSSNNVTIQEEYTGGQ